MLVAPTERELRSLGRSSSIPERHGCDFLIFAKSRLGRQTIGVQRKAIPDLLASIADGRLQKEIGQIQSSHLLHHAILVVEGRFQWTNEGQLVDSVSTFTKGNWYGIQLSLQNAGLKILTTDSVKETRELLLWMQTYFSRIHTTLLRRPKPKSSWGKGSNQSYALHLLQSFDGVGPTTANAIYETFGGVPLSWDVTEKELSQVPGVGKITARKLLAALEKDEENG